MIFRVVSPILVIAAQDVLVLWARLRFVPIWRYRVERSLQRERTYAVYEARFRPICFGGRRFVYAERCRFAEKRVAFVLEKEREFEEYA